MKIPAIELLQILRDLKGTFSSRLHVLPIEDNALITLEMGKMFGSISTVSCSQTSYVDCDYDDEMDGKQFLIPLNESFKILSGSIADAEIKLEGDQIGISIKKSRYSLFSEDPSLFTRLPPASTSIDYTFTYQEFSKILRMRVFSSSTQIDNRYDKTVVFCENGIVYAIIYSGASISQISFPKDIGNLSVFSISSNMSALLDATIKDGADVMVSNEDKLSFYHRNTFIASTEMRSKAEEQASMFVKSINEVCNEPHLLRIRTTSREVKDKMGVFDGLGYEEFSTRVSARNVRIVSDKEGVFLKKDLKEYGIEGTIHLETTEMSGGHIDKIYPLSAFRNLKSFLSDDDELEMFFLQNKILIKCSKIDFVSVTMEMSKI